MIFSGVPCKHFYVIFHVKEMETLEKLKSLWKLNVAETVSHGHVSVEHFLVKMKVCSEGE